MPISSIWANKTRIYLSNVRDLNETSIIRFKIYGLLARKIFYKKRINKITQISHFPKEPSPLKPSYHTKGNKTKCMTKSGQGSLVKVMEHSFSLCIEKAREQTQGAGSAIVKWFNLQSLTEVKSQLETMHLLFGVPRFFCSREFSNVYLKSLYLKINVFEIWKYCPARPAENCNFSKRFLIKN